jgi:hypothetical protein
MNISCPNNGSSGIYAANTAAPRLALKPRTARIAPENPVFCSCEFKNRTRAETTAIRIREAGIPPWAQRLRLTVRAPLASHVHTLTLAMTELCFIAVSEVA